MVKLHSVIKFWARKSPTIINELIPMGTRSLLDPFCGSGVSGYVGVLKKVKKIVLSDINPVAIFITHTILDKTILDDKIFTEIREICSDLVKEAYTIELDGKKFVIEKVAWTTNYVCPYHDEVVDARNARKLRSRFLYCPRCNKRFLPANVREFFEEPFEIYAYNESGEKKILRDFRLLEAYVEECKKFKATSWFPDGEFSYPDGTPFLQHPRRIKKVSELFTERGLFVASTLYQYIEDIWIKDPKQGDLLKLAFISSIVSATKMLPYSKTSGTSWKLPRYWIPHVRYEKNFCNTFLRKLGILRKFKNTWYTYIKDYRIRATYDSNYLPKLDDHTISIIRSDARNLNVDSNFDLIIIDPPHYAEINFYELTYLWQLWLKGRYNDSRFTDFSYWKHEIDVNPRLGRNLTYYIDELARIASKYTNLLSNRGKLIIIIHNRNKEVFNETVKRVKEYIGNGNLHCREVITNIPSSAQGIHGIQKQRLYLLIIDYG